MFPFFRLRFWLFLSSKENKRKNTFFFVAKWYCFHFACFASVAKTSGGPYEEDAGGYLYLLYVAGMEVEQK